MSESSTLSRLVLDARTSEGKALRTSLIKDTKSPFSLIPYFTNTVINQHDAERIRCINKQEGDSTAMQELLEIIKKGGHNGVRELKSALLETDQLSLAVKVQKSIEIFEPVEDRRSRAVSSSNSRSCVSYAHFQNDPKEIPGNNTGIQDESSVVTSNWQDDGARQEIQRKFRSPHSVESIGTVSPETSFDDNTDTMSHVPSQLSTDSTDSLSSLGTSASKRPLLKKQSSIFEETSSTSSSSVQQVPSISRAKSEALRLDSLISHIQRPLKSQIVKMLDKESSLERDWRGVAYQFQFDDDQVDKLSIGKTKDLLYELGIIGYTVEDLITVLQKLKRLDVIEAINDQLDSPVQINRPRIEPDNCSLVSCKERTDSDQPRTTILSTSVMEPVEINTGDHDKEKLVGCSPDTRLSSQNEKSDKKGKENKIHLRQLGIRYASTENGSSDASFDNKRISAELNRAAAYDQGDRLQVVEIRQFESEHNVNFVDHGHRDRQNSRDSVAQGAVDSVRSHLSADREENYEMGRNDVIQPLYRVGRESLSQEETGDTDHLKMDQKPVETRPTLAAADLKCNVESGCDISAENITHQSHKASFNISSIWPFSYLFRPKETNIGRQDRSVTVSPVQCSGSPKLKKKESHAFSTAEQGMPHEYRTIDDHKHSVDNDTGSSFDARRCGRRRLAVVINNLAVLQGRNTADEDYENLTNCLEKWQWEVRNYKHQQGSNLYNVFGELAEEEADMLFLMFSGRVAQVGGAYYLLPVGAKEPSKFNISKLGYCLDNFLVSAKAKACFILVEFPRTEFQNREVVCPESYLNTITMRPNFAMAFGECPRGTDYRTAASLIRNWLNGSGSHSITDLCSFLENSGFHFEERIYSQSRSILPLQLTHTVQPQEYCVPGIICPVPTDPRRFVYVKVPEQKQKMSDSVGIVGNWTVNLIESIQNENLEESMETFFEEMKRIDQHQVIFFYYEGPVLQYDSRLILLGMDQGELTGNTAHTFTTDLEWLMGNLLETVIGPKIICLNTTCVLECRDDYFSDIPQEILLLIPKHRDPSYGSVKRYRDTLTKTLNDNQGTPVFNALMKMEKNGLHISYFGNLFYA